MLEMAAENSSKWLNKKRSTALFSSPKSSQPRGCSGIVLVESLVSHLFIQPLKRQNERE